MTIKEVFERVPKVILGPILVVLGMIYFTLADPPKTVCDIQFEIFKNKTIDPYRGTKYIYELKSNNITTKPLIEKDLLNCRTTNSPGGCYDLIKGLKKLLQDVHFIPAECRDRMSELEPLGKYLRESIWLFSHISWNSNPVVRKGIYNWLDNEDIAVFCKTKKEMIRLYGEPYWKSLEAWAAADLVRTKKIEDQVVSTQEAMERSVLSHNCVL